MKWIEVKQDNDLPRDGRPFLAVWKGRICFAQYDDEDRKFFLSYEPSWTGIFSIGHDRIHKFTHWAPLPHIPGPLLNELNS